MASVPFSSSLTPFLWVMVRPRLGIFLMSDASPRVNGYPPLERGGTRCSSSLRTTKASNCKRSNSEQRARALTPPGQPRSEEHTSELQSLMRISYAVYCLKKKKESHTI